MKNRLILMSLTWLTLSGCSHYYYVPGVHNVPLFTEKNETRVSGSFGFGEETKSIEVQGAWSVTDNIGVQANFMTAWGGDVKDRDFGNGICFDGALGYFKPAGQLFVFEFYGGFGASSQQHEYSGLNYDAGTGIMSHEYYGSSDLSFVKLFCQPAFGLKHNLFEIAFSTRFSDISFLRVDDTVYGSSNIYNELSALGNKGHLFLEPAGTLRIGWNNIKLQLQAIYTWYLNDKVTYIQEEGHLSAGLVFTFPFNNSPKQ